jgi:hypothetical protein
MLDVGMLGVFDVVFNAIRRKAALLERSRGGRLV